MFQIEAYGIIVTITYGLSLRISINFSKRRKKRVKMKHKHRWRKVGGTWDPILGVMFNEKKRCLDCGATKEK